LKKSYDSQNAVSTIRQASLTYKKTDHFDFDFSGSLLGEAPVRCVDYGNLVRESESYHEYSHSITRAVRELLEQGTIHLVIGGDHGTTIPVLKAYDAFMNPCLVQINLMRGLANKGALMGMDFVEEVPKLMDGSCLVPPVVVPEILLIPPNSHP
jgi:arginase family enzyme